MLMLGWRWGWGDMRGHFAVSGEKGALECEQRHLWVRSRGKAHLAGRGRVSRFSGVLSLAVAIDCQALL